MIKTFLDGKSEKPIGAIDSELMALVATDIRRKRAKNRELLIDDEMVLNEIENNMYDFLSNEESVYHDQVKATKEKHKIHKKVARDTQNYLDDLMFTAKAIDGKSPLDKLQNLAAYVKERLLAEQKEEQSKQNKGEGKPNKGEDLEEELKRRKEEIDRTRSELERQRQDEQQINSKDEVLRKSLELITELSKEKERRRTKIERVSQVHQASKVQMALGKELLLYKAIKKSLRVKTRTRKDKRVYISVDASGSMQEVHHLVKKFISELLASKQFDVQYVTWNETLNGKFVKITDKFRYSPDGEDNLYRCSKQSIEEITEKAVLFVITDGTTYLCESEFKEMIDLAKAKDVAYNLISFGRTSNYCPPKGYEDRLIAYSAKGIKSLSDDYYEEDKEALDDDFD